MYLDLCLDGIVSVLQEMHDDFEERTFKYEIYFLYDT